MAGLEDIRGIERSGDRLGALETFVTSSIKSGRTHSVPLPDALQMAITALAEVRARAETAESTRVDRLSQNCLIRALTTLWFDRQSVLNSESDIRHVTRHAVSAEDWQLSGLFRQFLMVSSDWMLSRYIDEQLNTHMSRMPPGKRCSFKEHCDELASKLSAAHGALRPKSPGPDIIRNLRDCRAAAQIQDDRFKTRVQVMAPRPIPARAARLFSVDISPHAHHEQPLYGVIVFEADRYHLWYSLHWTRFVVEYCSIADAARSASHKELFDRLDEGLEFGIRSDYSFRSIADDSGPQPRIRQIGVSDLTDRQIPLSLVLDPEVRYQWIVGEISDNRIQDGNIDYWGGIQFDSKPREDEADNDLRQVRNGKDGSLWLEYPHTQEHSISRNVLARPLPFAHFERWLLEDLCASSNRHLRCRGGQHATRTAFLSSDWSDTRVLHISTHGISDEENAECSYFLLSASNGQKTVVHFADILAHDFSNVDLVFLNTCLTGAGRGHFGESALSIAWAFLAAGTKFVIASRWPVQDIVAYRFANEFYTRMLREGGTSIAESFRDTLGVVRSDTRCDRPCQWGTFQLLNRPDKIIALTGPDSEAEQRPRSDRRLGGFRAPKKRTTPIELDQYQVIPGAPDRIADEDR